MTAIYLHSIHHLPVLQVVVFLPNGPVVCCATYGARIEVRVKAEAWHSWVNSTSRSGVADELSFRVRKLDVVCSRVSDALKLVDDLLELRECADQVMKAISSEDFEQAARFVSRFRASQDSLPPGTDDATVRTLLETQRLNGSRQERQSFQGIVRCHRSQGGTKS
ncbi:COG4 [Symbiodinium necroappetens]|uniref:COG4 protein n=1 Tax=Symbiodinium necroappetens TaxID=1628268 RepID=A0A813A1L0_9DINO|nr:COG4 [Symbiodinium necroappetens]